MFIPTPLTLCSWICSIKGWVVLQSLILSAEYFAAAYVLREIVFPVLKGLFENIGFFHSILEPWIKDVKVLFYGALLYFLIGIAGLIGALLEMAFLLIPYAIYLVVGFIIAAKKTYAVFQSVLDAEKDLKKACNIMSGLFGGNCNDTFDEIRNYTYGAAAAVTLVQASTLICTLLLIRRIYKKTGTIFTCCGHACGGGRHKSSSNDLEKALPLGRAHRRALTVQERREKVSQLPNAAFSLPRRSQAGQRMQQAEAPFAAFQLGRPARRGGRRYQLRAPIAATSSAADSEGLAGCAGMGSPPLTAEQRTARRLQVDGSSDDAPHHDDELALPQGGDEGRLGRIVRHSGRHRRSGDAEEY
ncbi:hypothetical protein JCM10213v2_001024 [Rhodosporidiobolus nylandii]